MKVAISGNYRTLLVEMLMLDWKDTFFLFQDAENNCIEMNLSRQGIKTFCYYRTYNKFELLNFISYYTQQKKLKQYINDNKLQCENVFEVYGSDHIYSIFRWFLNVERISVVEEGAANYFQQEELYRQRGHGTLRYILKKILLGQGKLLNYKPYGYDERVQRIFLSGLDNIPEDLLNKTTLFSLEDLWKKAPYQKRDIINRIFDVNFEIYEGAVLVLTQPLSESGLCTEKRKIQIYREVCKKESENSKVILKRHPRDITDYSVIPDVYIDTGMYPFELLLLNHVKIHKVTAILSTAALAYVNYCTVEMIGTTQFPELQKKIGVYEKKIYKNK